MTTIAREKLKYRQGVNGIVVDSNNNYLLVQKKSYGENQWEFPGGGLDEGEDPETGLLRELQEELGSCNFKILYKSSYIHQFEWPDSVVESHIQNGKPIFRGQQKYQYIVLFTGNKNEIKAQEEEIKKIKWVSYNELESHLIFKGQWQNAEKVILEYKRSMS